MRNRIAHFVYHPITNITFLKSIQEFRTLCFHLFIVYSLLTVMKLEFCSGVFLTPDPRWSPACRLLWLFFLFCLWKAAELLIFQPVLGLSCWNTCEKTLKLSIKAVILTACSFLLFLSYSPSPLKSLFSVLLLHQGVSANEVSLFGRDWVQPCGPALLPLRHGAGDCLPRMSNCGHQFGDCSCAAASRQPV